jgi:hypothetical protein
MTKSESGTRSPFNGALIARVRKLMFSLTRGEIKQVLLDSGFEPKRLLQIPIVNNMKSPQYLSKEELVSTMFDQALAELDKDETDRILTNLVAVLESKGKDVSELREALAGPKSHAGPSGEADKKPEPSESVDAPLLKGLAYANQQHDEYDVFISHASEDKTPLVERLADSLRHRGLRVWYDKFCLTVGDSLRRSIDDGLAKSRYGIVILSPHFFKKEWPQKELDGLAAREDNGTKVILPVWHNITRHEVLKYSPMLADRVALLTSNGLEYVVEGLLKVIRPSDAHDEAARPEAQQASDIPQDSTVFFSERMAAAFPGTRGLLWLDSPERCLRRLNILLKEPLVTQKGDGLYYPIWWWRGPSNLSVERFAITGPEQFLMNEQEIHVSKIAAYRGQYYRELIYVEAYAEKPTGLYHLSPEDFTRYKEQFGYVWEEYGILGDRFITRAEYDDGAAIVNGDVVDAKGSELRVRYVTSYNFIIAAHMSPLNNIKFDRVSEEYLNGILGGSHGFEDFLKLLLELPQQHKH